MKPLKFNCLLFYICLFALEAFLLLMVGASNFVYAETSNNHYTLRFSGISTEQGRILRTQFPQLSEKQITLSEVDNIVRHLMKTRLYSNIEVDQKSPQFPHELLLVATALRKINSISISGNHNLGRSRILEVLKLKEDNVFERKELLESVKHLQFEYRKIGYRSMNAEIDFATPNDSEVGINIKIDEGQPTLVEAIQIESPNPAIVSRGERLLKKFKGRSLSEEDLQTAIKSFAEDLRDNRFLMARILDPQATFNDDQTRVRITLAIEQPWKFEFRFRGNSHISDQSLVREMNLEQLNGTVTTPAPELAERLRRAYQGKGFAHILITSREKTVEAKFQKEITFQIDEGPRVRIKLIEISGNISRPGSYYGQFITSSSHDLLGEGYYNRKDIEVGIKELEEELQNQGYLHAKVKSWRTDFSNPVGLGAAALGFTATPNKRGGQATIYLNIDEGPLTVVRQVRFDGVKSFSQSELSEIVPIKKQESLRLKDLNQSIELIKNFYHSNGFVEMTIANEKEGLITYNETNTQATIEFQIQEGPQVKVGSIIISGTDLTKDHVILRELTFHEGDVFTPESRDESIFHLQRLGLFSTVRIRTLEENTSVTQRTIVIEVEESAPGTFESGIGVAFDRDWVFRGYAGIAYRNLWGTGRAISLRGDPSYSSNPQISYPEYKLAVSYLEPYFLKGRNKGRINLIHDVHYIGNDSLGRSIFLSKNELGLQVERDLTQHLKLTYTAYNISSQNEFDRKLPDQITRTQNIAKTGPQFEYDLRDNVFYPTSGIYLQLGAEYSDPAIGSSEDRNQSIKFTKINSVISYPFRIAGSSKWIFATSLRSGYLANLSDRPQSGVPDQEAFFLGGRSTLRGFQPTGAAMDLERVPNLAQLGKANLRDFYVTNDSYYYLIKAELRFPIYGDFYGAAFYDGGAVILSQMKIDRPYRDSAGLALRIQFAGGIVAGLEYGRKLERRYWAPYGYENPDAWHISIGTF